MAFKVHKTDDGRVMPCEYMPAQGLTPRLGMALKMENGKLAKASGAARPAYISMTERKEACGEDELIPVLRVGADVIWETAPSGDVSGLKIGDKVTISEDGMEATASKGGAAEVVGADEAAGVVLVRFGGACEACE